MQISSLFDVSAPLWSCDADLCNADLVTILRECVTLALLCKSKESLAWQVVLHVGFVRVALFMASERGSRFRNVSLPGSWITHVMNFEFPGLDFSCFLGACWCSEDTFG